MVEIKKRRKSSRMHGRKMGTHGTGARKKNKGSGHRGGKGMSGSGKRNDQKKTLVLKLYGGKYFGKQGETSKGTQKDKDDRINLISIESNLGSFVKKGIAKQTSKGYEIDLKSYTILGEGKLKKDSKFIITAKKASKSAIEKIKSAGGEIILPQNKVKVSKKVESEN